jgi:hypothetical protein
MSIKPYTPGFDKNEFDTDNGISYSVYLQDVSNDGIKAYSFGFEPIGIGMDAPPRDPRVSDTICAVIEMYLSKHDCIIIYWPYEEDLKRVRLFDIWFTRYVGKVACGKLMKTKVVIKIEKTDIHICIIAKEELTEYVNSKIATGNLPQVWEDKN